MATIDERRSVTSALAAVRTAFIGIALLSATSNVLMLVSPLFMMQVYDRVLASHSIPTLAAISVLAAGVYLTLAIIEILRAKILLQIGRRLDEQLVGPSIRATIHPAPPNDSGKAAPIAMRDLDQIRLFMSGPGPIAIADLPWTPIFVILLYLFHPAFGLVVIGGAIVLLGLTLLSEIMLREPARQAGQLLASRWDLIQAARRNGDSLIAMGMAQSFSTRISRLHDDYSAQNFRSSDLTATSNSVAKIFRMALQSAILALGALLVIDQLASPGVIIAASVLAAKALSPIEMATSNWRGFITARQSARSLQDTLSKSGTAEERMPLPSPCRSLSVAGLAIRAPAQSQPIVQGVTFNLTAGSCLGIIGPSGCGKSSLGRTLVGAWPAPRGTIRLDGAEIGHWDSEALGASIGYLPQTVELFSGTVAENIGRFSQTATSDAVIDAARRAHAHDMILSLPKGYDTQIGSDGGALSGGQRQRIGLARALFGKPFLVVLDEPNSNLDAEGEMALARAISSARDEGSIVVVIAHRAGMLRLVDHVLVLNAGSASDFGPRDEIMKKLRMPGEDARRVVS